MTALEILKEYANINLSINSKLDYVNSIKEMRLKMQSEGSLDIAEKSITKIEEEVIGKIERLCRLKDTADNIVNSVPDIVQRAILERRYLIGEKWTTISEKTGYCIRQATRIHKSAINFLEKAYPDIEL